VSLLTQKEIITFQTTIYNYYHEHGRSFIWRQTTDPYHIVVSEIMLQQTQTERVKEKFVQFITALPTFEALAAVSTRDVIALWHGLGYSRRALALVKIAQHVMRDYSGVLPASPEILETFPGIGAATAGSICAFAFNMPTLFIETNIRTVYIHTFFACQGDISDKQIFPLLEQTLDKNNARHWYYALTDYGVMLKKKFKNPARKSAHHAVQSKFEGSERQIRGMILRALTDYPALPFEALCSLIPREPARVERNLEALCQEGFVKRKNAVYYI